MVALADLQDSWDHHSKAPQIYLLPSGRERSRHYLVVILQGRRVLGITIISNQMGFERQRRSADTGCSIVHFCGSFCCFFSVRMVRC